MTKVCPIDSLFRERIIQLKSKMQSYETDIRNYNNNKGWLFWMSLFVPSVIGTHHCKLVNAKRELDEIEHQESLTYLYMNAKDPKSSS